MLPPDVEAHVEQRRRVFEALALTLANVWAVADYDDADGFLERVLPAVNASLATQAAIGSAWIAQQVGGRLEAPPVDYRRLRGGKPAEAVYRRPLLEIGRQINQGADWEKATKAAGERLQILGMTDQQSAYQDRVFNLLRRRLKVKRYRRAVSGPNACSRCVTAAGQLLATNEVMPRHPQCRCAIVPIVGPDDPGLLIANGADAAKIKIRVEDHDELGPTLVEAGHAFTPLQT